MGFELFYNVPSIWFSKRLALCRHRGEGGGYHFCFTLSNACNVQWRKFPGSRVGQMCQCNYDNTDCSATFVQGKDRSTVKCIAQQLGMEGPSK
ncbi:hypothetical protein K1719_014686 [Acacia pycnantha]|nr:hypothetical protein K1719_014686 [Acacia pycnantha]